MKHLCFVLAASTFFASAGQAQQASTETYSLDGVKITLTLHEFLSGMHCRCLSPKAHALRLWLWPRMRVWSKTGCWRNRRLRSQICPIWTPREMPRWKAVMRRALGEQTALSPWKFSQNSARDDSARWKALRFGLDLI